MKKKRSSIKKKGKLGKIGQVAQKKRTKKKVPKQATSARPGGSKIKTKKPGSGAKSPRPDPTKVGLLGAFGKGGLKQQLDKAFTGAGELGGLADKATGSSGTKETYVGKGIGTKF